MNLELCSWHSRKHTDWNPHDIRTCIAIAAKYCSFTRGYCIFKLLFSNFPLINLSFNSFLSAILKSENTSYLSHNRFYIFRKEKYSLDWFIWVIYVSLSHFKRSQRIHNMYIKINFHEGQGMIWWFFFKINFCFHIFLIRLDYPNLFSDLIYQTFFYFDAFNLFIFFRILFNGPRSLCYWGLLVSLCWASTLLSAFFSLTSCLNHIN